jgi:DNA-binding response OmpR family regulator
MKPTLLIAESDAELCDVYQRYLTERGYAVETASDGLACLERLRRGMPAVAVLDVQLRWGGADGVLAWLRAERAESEVPVILTATAGDPRHSAPGIEPPVVQLLPKPFALTALLETVQAVMGQRRNGGPFNGGRVSAGSELFIG